MSYSQWIQEHTTHRYLCLMHVLQLELHPHLLHLSYFPSASQQALWDPCAPAPWHSSLLGIVCCGCLDNPRGLGTSSSYLGFMGTPRQDVVSSSRTRRNSRGSPHNIRNPALRLALLLGLSYSFF